MRKVAIVLLAAIAVLSAACGATNTSSGATKAGVGVLNGKTGAQILSAATAAERKVGAARYVLTATSGSQHQTISGDASGNNARQTVTLGSQNVQVIEVGGAVYVEGNAAGLGSAMGLSSATASKYADKWISVQKTDSVYSAIVDSVSLDKTLSALAPTGKLTLTAPLTVGGRQAIGVHGGLPQGTQSGVTGSETIYVASTDPTVPLEFKGTASTGVTDVGTFSHWGETLHLSVPSPTVPYTTVTAK
jgi:hypothetical protein